jgi:hypothetical protein
MKANVSCSGLSVLTTCEHMNAELSSPCLQSIGRSGKLGEPSRSNPDALGPATPEDQGAGVVSPGVAHLGAPMPAPHITQSQSKPSVSSPGRRLALSIATLMMPSDASSTLGALAPTTLTPLGPAFPVTVMPPRASTGMSPGLRRTNG